jgi:hypothetical protein
MTWGVADPKLSTKVGCAKVEFMVGWRSVSCPNGLYLTPAAWSTPRRFSFQMCEKLKSVNHSLYSLVNALSCG